jgi:hypothetical protein
MLPLYQVLIVVVLGVAGAGLYLYRPDDPADTNEKRQECRNCRNLGLAMVIIAAMAALYILFFSKLSFRATMDNDDAALMAQQAASIQQQQPVRRRSWADTVAEVGGKFVDMASRNTQAVLSNPETTKMIFDLAAGSGKR